MRMIKITTDDEIEVIEVNGYEEMAKAIDADLIERVTFRNELLLEREMARKTMSGHFVMVVDESGLIKHKVMNPLGCYLYAGQAIVGDMLLAWEDMTAEGPDFVDMPQAMIDYIKYVYAIAKEDVPE